MPGPNHGPNTSVSSAASSRAAPANASPLIDWAPAAAGLAAIAYMVKVYAKTAGRG